MSPWKNWKILAQSKSRISEKCSDFVFPNSVNSHANVQNQERNDKLFQKFALFSWFCTCAWEFTELGKPFSERCRSTQMRRIYRRLEFSVFMVEDNSRQNVYFFLKPIIKKLILLPKHSWRCPLEKTGKSWLSENPELVKSAPTLCSRIL